MLQNLPALRTFVLELMFLYMSCDYFYATSQLYVKTKFLVHSFGIDWSKIIFHFPASFFKLEHDKQFLNILREKGQILYNKTIQIFNISD